MLTQSDVIYFIITDRFCAIDSVAGPGVDRNNPQAYHGGNFEGIISKIPYLKNLGVTAVWLTPVYLNSHLPDQGKWGYHGYWPLDFESVDPHLYAPAKDIPEGSKLHFKRFVDTLHASGLKVIQDMVVNHTGYNPPCLQGETCTPIRPHWYNAEALTSLVDGRLSGLPDLDQDNIEVADYCIRVVMDWIRETGIDCIRMDTAKHVEKIFWHYYKTYVKGRYPYVSLIGEVLEWDIQAISAFQKHFAFDSLFDFPLQKAMEDVFIHDASLRLFASPHLSPDEFKGILDYDNVYTNHNKLVNLLDNHDLPARFMTSTLRRMGGVRSNAVRTYKLAISFMLTMRGIPQIFYGNEIGLEGGADPDNRRDMPWEVMGAGLEPTPDHAFEREIFLHTQLLLRTRASHPALMYGNLTTLYVDDLLYVYLRDFEDDVLIVAINNGYMPMPTPLLVAVDINPAIPPRVRTRLRGKLLEDLLDPSRPKVRVMDGLVPIEVPGKSASLFCPV